jgi:hypothetical protein
MKRHALKIVALLSVLAGCSPAMTGVKVYYPGDAPPVAAARYVEMRYFGNGGWLIRRDRDVIATAPFVSNPVGAEIYVPARSDVARIENTVPAMPDVEAMLIGHTHYDHAMDLPYIMRTLAPQAKLYGSKTAKQLLGKTLGQARIVDVTEGGGAADGETPGRWFPTPDTSVRFMPLLSTHAPHVLGFIKVVSWKKSLDRDLEEAELPTVPAEWPEGETVAFLIDFLRPDKTVEFRVYYQDAAAHLGKGTLPKLSPPDDVPVDVAILCVAGFSQVPGNPEGILRNVKPRYVVGGHWEDFFSRSPDLPPQVAVGTSLEEFVRKTQSVMKVPVYVPAPGKKLFIPIEQR